MSYSVEEMCKAGCTTRRGVRYWEQLGLLGTVDRKGKNRTYTSEQLDIARIIAAAQFGGFSLDLIKAMLADFDDEAHEAITYRLELQARAAMNLSAALPAPKAKQEFDL